MSLFWKLVTAWKYVGWTAKDWETDELKSRRSSLQEKIEESKRKLGNRSLLKGGEYNRVNTIL